MLSREEKNCYKKSIFISNIRTFRMHFCRPSGMVFSAPDSHTVGLGFKSRLGQGCFAPHPVSSLLGEMMVTHFVLLHKWSLESVH